MDVDTTSYDKSQVDQLEDRCIIVDKEDRIIGSASKKDCHIAANRSKGDLKSAGGKLHRAFSVFLFNSKNELLLQKRSKLKITYPGCYTNTCCSHPRATNIEMNDHEHIGVKIAAQRRMQFELGIPATQVMSFWFQNLAQAICFRILFFDKLHIRNLFSIISKIEAYNQDPILEPILEKNLGSTDIRLNALACC